MFFNPDQIPELMGFFFPKFPEKPTSIFTYLITNSIKSSITTKSIQSRNYGRNPYHYSVYKENPKITQKQSPQFQLSPRRNAKGFRLEPIPSSSRDHLAGPHVKLAGTVSHGGPIVVDVADEPPAAVALDLRPRPLDPPVVSGLEERPDLVLLLEPELGGVDRRKRHRSLVSGLEEEVRRVEVRCGKVQVGSALRTSVDR